MNTRDVRVIIPRFLSKSMPVDTGYLRTLAIATQRAGVWNTPTLVIYDSATIVGTGKDKLVKDLQQAGAGLLLGTDVVLGPACDVTRIHRELQWLVRVGLTPYQALAMGTKNVAAYFGTQRESGTITVGKRADLVLLSGNPLAEIRATEHPLGVMLHGQWFTQDELTQRLTVLRAADTP
jgi:imidazolonepropionase-like amidohydrolase